MQHLWQVHYQVLLIILQKEFIKLNVKIMIVSLNMKGITKYNIVKKYKSLSCNKDYSNKLDEKLKLNSLKTQLSFLMIK